MLVAIEGINGSGKSTITKLVAKALDFEQIRFPGDDRTELGVGIRKLLYSGNFESAYAKLFLFLADMANTYSVLKYDKNYIADRSIVSTLAYQSIEGMPKELVYHCAMSSGVYLDHVFYLDIDTEIAFERLNNRKEKTLEGFRDREIEFYEKVDTEYRKALENVKHTVIDTNGKSETQIADEIVYSIKDMLNGKEKKRQETK